MNTHYIHTNAQYNRTEQENSAIADKPRDAFRDQSKRGAISSLCTFTFTLPNIVPFDKLGMVSY